MSRQLAVLDPAGLVQPYLNQVETSLFQAADSEIELLREAAFHILGAGGKRIRPLITLLVNQALDGRPERAVPLAAACELVHTATLVHDDVVDASDSRRGRMSVQFHFGNSASVLMGDFLVVRAFGLVSREPDRALWNVMVDTIARMCEGEVLQICVKGQTDITVDVYETIIECKTALLISTCARLGAAAAGALPEQIEDLADWGYRVGMAFQIQDDILDFTGDEEILGKPVGSDLREGKVTLPAIYALQSATRTAQDRLLQIYGKSGPLTPGEVGEATRLIDEAGGFERAVERARGYINASRERLACLPPSQARLALEDVAEQVVDRRS